MSDQFTETTTTGLGGRLINSLFGVLIGAVMFLVSFPVLYWNEGRIDLSGIARAAPELAADQAGAGENAGKLVSLSGTISGSEPVGDGLYLKPGPYVGVKRVTELYAWTERSETRTEKHVGGSETKTTTYSYSREWRELPEQSARFHDPEGHANPPEKAVQSQEFRPGSAAVGAHRLELAGLQLPYGGELPLGADNFLAPSAAANGPAAALAPPSYVYLGTGNAGAPATGDLRIKYAAVRNGTQVTVLGKLGQGGELSGYTHPSGQRLYRVFEGSHDDAVATMHGEFATLTWILRGAGFLLMWLGMMLFFGPVDTLLDVLPFLGGVARGVSGFVTLPVCLALSALTIVISKILHNPAAVAVAAIVILGAVFYRYRRGHETETVAGGLRRAS